MASVYTNKAVNVRKTWFLMSSFFIVIILLGFIISQLLGSYYILYIAVFLSITINLYAYWNADKKVIKMTGAKPMNRKEHFEAWNLLENLAITSGIPMPKLYYIDDPAPNAFATGRDVEHSAVVVTTGLLESLDKNELEGVLAHELSHILNRDTLIMTVTVILVGLIAVIADLLFRTVLFGGGMHRNIHPAILIGGLVVAIIVIPLMSRALHFAISRKREFLADASGAHITRYPDGLASALQKISQHEGGMKKASTATAHLFIANPFSKKMQEKKAGRFNFSKFFSTHPPINERIDALRKMV